MLVGLLERPGRQSRVSWFEDARDPVTRESVNGTSGCPSRHAARVAAMEGAVADQGASLEADPGSVAGVSSQPSARVRVPPRAVMPPPQRPRARRLERAHSEPEDFEIQRSSPTPIVWVDGPIRDITEKSETDRYVG